MLQTDLGHIILAPKTVNEQVSRVFITGQWEGRGPNLLHRPRPAPRWPRSTEAAIRSHLRCQSGGSTGLRAAQRRAQAETA